VGSEAVSEPVYIAETLARLFVIAWQSGLRIEASGYSSCNSRLFLEVQLVMDGNVLYPRGVWMLPFFTVKILYTFRKSAYGTIAEVSVHFMQILHGANIANPFLMLIYINLRSSGSPGIFAATSGHVLMEDPPRL